MTEALTPSQREAAAYMRGAKMAYNDAADFIGSLPAKAPKDVKSIVETICGQLAYGLREKSKIVNEMTMESMKDAGTA